jgi:hypothetical protein
VIIADEDSVAELGSYVRESEAKDGSHREQSCEGSSRVVQAEPSQMMQDGAVTFGAAGESRALRSSGRSRPDSDPGSLQCE